MKKLFTDGLNKRTNYREVRVLLEKLNIGELTNSKQCDLKKAADKKIKFLNNINVQELDRRFKLFKRKIETSLVNV